MTTIDLATTSTGTDPYVAIGTDPDTGQAIIALDAAAVSTLTDILDDIVNDGRFSDPDAHGLTTGDATRQSAVAHAILGPLLKMQGYLS